MQTKLKRSEDYFSELVNKYTDVIYRLSLTYLRNICDAEDMCQIIFTKIFELDKYFVDSEHEKAWIIRSTINACKDILRTPWKRRFIPIDNLSLPIKSNENREVVEQVLKLPVKYRSVIYLYYYEGYSTMEIAGLLGKKEPTIRTQLKRARELLKTKLGEEWEND